MHRRMVVDQVKKSTDEDLINWRSHVLNCLNYYKRDNNQFEIEECEYVLSLIDEQMKLNMNRESK